MRGVLAIVLTTCVGCGSPVSVGSDAAPPIDATVEGTLSLPDGGLPACATCSADLHEVIGCDGGVLTQCPNEQACVPGQGCVPACVAAAAANTTAGCDFYLGTVPPESTAAGSCYVAFVANAWSSPATITASWGTTPLDLSQIARVPAGSGSSLTYAPLPGGTLPGGEVAVLFLSASLTGLSSVPCPIAPGITQPTSAP